MLRNSRRTTPFASLGVAAFLLASLLASGCGTAFIQPGTVGDPPLPGETHSGTSLSSLFTQYEDYLVPRQMIVRFKDGTSGAEMAAIRDETGVRQLDSLLGGLLQLLEVPEATTLLSIMTQYAGMADVEYVEPNLLVTTCVDATVGAFPNVNDPLFSRQWNMRAIRVPEAWAAYGGGSANVVVAVVDTGVAYADVGLFRKAPDLGSTRFTTGYDFVHGDSYAVDDQGHGTHVAGTIAQSTDNGLGVVGVAPHVTIMPIKVLDMMGGGTSYDVAAGIRYAVDNGANVINLSLGGPTPDMTMREACQYAYDRNVVVVAASGNDGAEVGYPAGYNTTICVGATDRRNDVTRYSNRGPEVDVVAPGGDTDADLDSDGRPDGILQQTLKSITSILPDPTEFDFVYLQGTSMATPHVTGAVAMLFSYGLNAPNNTEAVRGIFRESCLDLGPSGKDQTYGYGLIQVDHALRVLSGGEYEAPDPWDPGEGEDDSPPPSGAITVRPGLASGWVQMGSPVDALPEDVFLTAPCNLLSWNPVGQDWLPTDRLTAAGGFFAYLETPVNALFDMRYRAVPSEYVSVPVDAGWSLLGNPYDRAMVWDADAIKVRVRSTGEPLGSLEQAWDTYYIAGFAYIWNPDIERYEQVADRELDTGIARDRIPPYHSVWVYSYKDDLELVWRGIDLPDPDSASSRSATESMDPALRARLIAQMERIGPPPAPPGR